MKLFREPLLHFLILGAGLFLLFGAVADRTGERVDQIVVSSGQIDHLVEVWTKTWQRPPTSGELQGLIKDYIKEEILYREARAMGLDKDDTIIRRRLRQKMECLAEDVAAAAEPTDEQLRAFLEENRDKFRVERGVTFSHVYLNRERRGTALAGDAERLLIELGKSDGRVDPSKLGDPFLMPREYRSVPESEVAKLFGRAFASRLLELEPGRWAGPVESGYGVHLVLVRERTERRLPQLAEVRETVRREWFAGRRREANDDEPRLGVAEAGHRTAPVLPVAEGRPFLPGHALAPLHQPRATPAGDDLLVESLQRVALRGHDSRPQLLTRSGTRQMSGRPSSAIARYWG